MRYTLRRGLLAIALAVLASAGCEASEAAGNDGSDTPPSVAAERCWPPSEGATRRECVPDDPKYRRRWEFRGDLPAEIDPRKMHPAEAALGSIGFDLDGAWLRTVGRDDVLLAVLDSGIRWRDKDLVHKLYLNRGELPPPAGAESHDANGDGRFDIRDYDGDPRVGDRNGNGHLDPEDLILVFSDCRDDDGNGYPDDISGYDFFQPGRCGAAGGDNNAGDDTDFGHGTGIASTAAAEANNGIRDAGVCPECRVLPVRVGDSFVVDANRFARGVVFATRAGADVIGAALGSYNNTPTARAAVDFAYDHGVTLIASAADEFAYHHNYPSVYNHSIYVNAIRFNHASDWKRGTTFWGLNPCTNFGPRVSLSVPAESCSSGATSRLTGVSGLVQSMAIEAGHGRLHAEEIYQLLQGTADDLDNRDPDWGEMRFPARAGFDQLNGYGRLNAARAVDAVAAGRIPPRVDLANPRWFAVISPARTPTLAVHGSIDASRAPGGTFALQYALGPEPAESDYVDVARGDNGSGREGAIGTLDFAKLPRSAGPPPTRRGEHDRYTVTLRLRVIDGNGEVAEARRSFFVLDDPSWKRHFPLDLGASGEAAPLFVDLDDDGRDELIVATADGRVRFIHWDEEGLAIQVAELDTSAPVDPVAPRSSLLGRGTPETAIRGPVAGDLDGDGAMEVVVVSREGSVYAFDGSGRRRAGFPVSLAPMPPGEAYKEQIVERGILSRPVLADLDGKPGREILVGAMDGRLYAWDGRGKTLDGFPLALSADGFGGGKRAKIISRPAVGDLDGDGLPEIVVGSNHLDEGLAAVWALHALPRPDAPRFLKGWRPMILQGLRPALLPTLASGVYMEPLLTDVDDDGDDEVVVWAVTGSETLLVDHRPEGPVRLARLALKPGAKTSFRDIAFIGGTGAGMIADTDGDGVDELYAPLLPFRMLTLRGKPGIPLDVPLVLGGWKLAPGEASESASLPMLEDYPRRMEDLMVFAHPSAADVDGDGRDEVLMGSGGYLLHAFSGAGEAPGFPKFTGGWIFSGPVTGDLEGDGRLDVVTVTREGYLFAWETAEPEAEPELEAESEAESAAAP